MLNIVLLILFALPIPLTVKALIGIFMSPFDILENYSFGFQFITLFTVLLACTYLVSYVISLVATLKNKKIKLISFLPLLHIALFCIFAFVSIQLETTEIYVDSSLNELRIRKNNEWIYNIDFTVYIDEQ